MGKRALKNGVFYFWRCYIYQSLKRGKVRHLMATLIWTYIFSYAKLKDFTYGLLDTACMWTDEEVLQCEFFHIYIICVCRLRNHLITLRWDAIAASNYTSRTLKTEKKGKNGTQFVFCKCIIRFFFSVVQKQHLRLI